MPSVTMNEGRRPPDRDESVDRAAQQADAQARRNRHGQRQSQSLEADAQHGPAQRQHGANGQVDSPDDQHECHPRRHHHHIGI